MQMPPIDRSANRVAGAAEPLESNPLTVPKARPADTSTPAATPDRRIDSARLRSPDTPSAVESPNKDWTAVRQKETVEAPPEPPKEPISKQLLEFLQSMWRASGTAVEIAQELNKPSDWQTQRKAEQLTYADPAKVKKTQEL